MSKEHDSTAAMLYTYFGAPDPGGALDRLYGKDEVETIEGVALAVVNKTTNHVTIFRLPKPNRHYHLFQPRMEHFKLSLEGDDMQNYHEANEEIQGFYTNKQLFVGRKTAKKIAVNSRQCKSETNSKELFSEDVW